MDKNDFISQAVSDLVGSPKKIEKADESVKRDAIVDMAVSDLTGGQKPVDVKAPTHDNINLAEAFNKSMTQQIEETKTDDQTKDNLAKEIYNEGHDVLGKMLKGLR